MQSAPKPCSQCGVLVRDGTPRCSAHPPVARYSGAHRGTRHERGYGSAWDKLRAVILQRDAGLCQPCRQRGTVTVATEVDHIIGKESGGTDDSLNLQSICRPCHKAKSAREGRRHAGRGGANV
jgi:5-methylcytosine-specific restriction protein A